MINKRFIKIIATFWFSLVTGLALSADSHIPESNALPEQQDGTAEVAPAPDQSAYNYRDFNHRDRHPRIRRDDLSIYNQQTTLRLDALKERYDLQINALNQRLDDQQHAQNNRITDLHEKSSQLQLSLEGFGLVITMLALIAGFIGYISVINKVKAQINWWFEAHTQDIEQRIEAFSKKLDGLEKHAEQSTEQYVDDLQQTKERIQNNVTGGQEIDPSTRQNINEADDALQQKPEAEYTFEDWNTRALAAYTNRKFGEAIFYWDRAIAMAVAMDNSDVKAEDIAKMMVNKGNTFGQLDPPQYQEAIAAYDQLIDQYGHSDNLALQEQCAMAIFNKGNTWGKLDPPQYKEKIATYDQLIAQYGNADNLALQELCAKAMFNKGITLSKLDPPQYQEAIDTYEQLIDQYGHSDNPVLQQICTMVKVVREAALGKLNPSA